MGARLPGWVRGGGGLPRTRRALAYGIAGFGLITTATAMAALHPHQQVYFNGLTDTKTPGALGKRYDMDYWDVATRQLLEYLLARYPNDTLRVYPADEVFSKRILPSSDRSRIVNSRAANADFYFNWIQKRHWLDDWGDAPDPPTLYNIRAYGSDFAFIIAPNPAAYHDYYRAEYEDVAANGTPLARAAFDIYVHNGALHYLNEDCASLKRNPDLRIFLQIVPANLADLPADSRERGFEFRGFRFNENTAFFDGKCILTQPLPPYLIARISTGYEGDAAEWRVDIDLAARELRERIAAGRYAKPVAQSDFDLYLSGNSLAYLKDPCLEGDADARFLLHIIPADPADLPADSREYGFENLNFQFADHGARIGDICVIERQLPAYPIDRIRAGQFISGGGAIWQVEFAAVR